MVTGAKYALLAALSGSSSTLSKCVAAFHPKLP
jgi:hypothetical protein